MPRKKSKQLKDVSVAIARAIEGVPEINASNIAVQDGGIICMTINDRPCKIKFSVEHGARTSKAKAESVLDGMLDMED